MPAKISFLRPVAVMGLGHLRIVERVHGRAIDNWNARQRLDEFWKGRAPHAVARGGGNDDRQFQQ